MIGRTPAKVALREAWEEADVKGRAIDHCLGLYAYEKRLSTGAIVPCRALVYPVHVSALAGHWPEHGQRRRKWFSRRKAVARIKSRDLSQVIRDFDPANLRA